MQNPLVSIIVPIYKVEPYLRRCIDSIVNQTYTNLEIILVDDGSPDGCPQICDGYAAKDKRVVVIHKENGGLSDARNAGLDICKGEYISFVDSDDWVDEKYIKILLDIAIKENADIVIGCFEEILNEQNFKSTSNNNQYDTFDSTELLCHLCKADLKGLMPSWGKIYTYNCFNNIHFPKNKLYEDAHINYKIYSNIKKACYTKNILYFYRIRDDSIMGKTKTSIHCLDVFIERYIFLKNRKESSLIEAALKNLCWDVLFAYSQLSNNKEVIAFNTKEEALNKYREFVHEYISHGKITLEKIILIFFATFPSIYLLYQNFSPYKIRKN